MSNPTGPLPALERGFLPIEEAQQIRSAGVGEEWLGKPTDEDVFRLYTLFCGDVARTAHAADRTEAEVREMVRVNCWDEKIKSIIELKNSGKKQDVERAVNRAINFIQAHKLRLFLEEVIRHLVNRGGKNVAEECYVSKTTKNGTVTSLNLRPFADLASALEKCHALSYMALDDSSTDRRERAREDSTSGLGLTATEMHMKLAQVMSGATFNRPPDPPAPLPPEPPIDLPPPPGSPQ
jgi:hypothetical protein